MFHRASLIRRVRDEINDVFGRQLGILMLRSVPCLRVEQELRIAHLADEREPVLARRTDVVVAANDKDGCADFCQLHASARSVFVKALGCFEIHLELFHLRRDIRSNVGARVDAIMRRTRRSAAELRSRFKKQNLFVRQVIDWLDSTFEEFLLERNLDTTRRVRPDQDGMGYALGLVEQYGLCRSASPGPAQPW